MGVEKGNIFSAVISRTPYVVTLVVNTHVNGTISYLFCVEIELFPEVTSILPIPL